MKRDHFVYEAYDTDGILLYVGCTAKPMQRYRAHMTGAGDARGWFNPFVTNWRASGPYPRDAAYRLEKKRIAEGQPIWNGHSDRNWAGRRELIADYLALHGVQYIDGVRPNRPELVAVKGKAVVR